MDERRWISQRIDNSMVIARGKGRVGVGWRWAKRGEMGTSVILPTIKIK